MTLALRRRLVPLLLALAALLAPAPGFGQVLRVVSWNTANDVGNSGTDSHPPGTSPWTAAPTGVFQAIAALNTGGGPRPIDILALQESVVNTTGVNPTAQAYANILNSLYPGAGYAVGTLNGATDGAATGNGPQTVVYRSTTVTLLSEQALGSVGTGAGQFPRQVMLYKFQAAGNPAAQFYLFNDHFKSGTAGSDMTTRGNEATAINTAANNLPANTPIIYAGDYNPTGNTSDPGYAGVVAGTGTHNNHGIDPLNPTNVAQAWDTSANRRFDTESPATSAFFGGQSTGGMEFRDDFLMYSPGMQSGNAVQYVANSFVNFGNTGTHTYNTAITTGSAATFAAQLSGYTTAQASTVLTQLTQAADHLPVVADYQITPVPEPSALALVVVAAVGGCVRRWRRSDAAHPRAAGGPANSQRA
ncbi:MAG TPA: PEP-CTERM sorting domain-containing protein [Gemmataceae bacterium]